MSEQEAWELVNSLTIEEIEALHEMLKEIESSREKN